MQVTHIQKSHTGRLALALACTLGLTAGAAPYTWDGDTDNNWMTGANWSPDGAPAGLGSDLLIFSGANRTGTVNDYPADTVFAGITFTNDYSAGKTAAFTNSGARIILNGNINTIISATQNGTIMDYITHPMLLGANSTFAVQLSGSRIHNLAIMGAIGEAAGGPYGITKTGSGELTLSGANTYSGKTVISLGRVWINSLTNVNSGASSLGNPATTATGIIDLTGRLSYTGNVSTVSDRLLNVTAAPTFENLKNTTTITLTAGITNTVTSGVTLRGSGNITVTGPILLLNGGGLNRTDPGILTLTNPNNYFGDIAISDGTISVNSISNAGDRCAMGTGSLVTLGQAGVGTTGKLLFTGATGASCNRSIRIFSMSGVSYGGTLENSVAGQTLTFSGIVYRGVPSVGFAPFTLTGAGNGVLSGNISSNICILKTGAGTWTLSGNNTCVGTNQVNGGTLLINGTMTNASPFIVNASGVLGGTGTIYGTVTSSGTLSPADTNIGTLTIANLTLSSGKLTNDLNSVAGNSDCIAVTNLFTLNGANVMTLRFPNGAAPSGVYTQMTYAAKTGTGTLSLDKTYPNTFLTVGETAVTITISDALTWTGSVNGSWDTGTANWSPVNYSEGKTVLFDDTGANTTGITIPVAVAPSFITVDAGLKPYAIGGAGIIGSASLTKAGTNVLTLASTNSYTGTTTVNAGTLTLSGSLSNSTVIVATNATFTQSAGSTIGGSTAEVNCQGIGTLSTANTYGGLTQVGFPGVTARRLTVTHNNALGTTNAGVIVNGGGTLLESLLSLGNGVVITGETATLNGANSYRAMLSGGASSGKSATWDGNILIDGAAYIRCENAGATFYVGATSDDTITGSSGTLSLRGYGTNVISSLVSIGPVLVQKDDSGTAIIQSTGNIWSETKVLEGYLKIGQSEALPATAKLLVGKIGKYSAAAVDLNGYTQTVGILVDEHSNGNGGTQRITSALPATLVVSNTVTSSFGTEGSVIEGNVSIIKANTGTLTLSGTNTMSGSFSLRGGTNVITATGTLGINCTNVTVTAGTLRLQAQDGISDTAIVTVANGGGAKIELDSGVVETVQWLNFGNKPRLPGRYSATGGPGITVDTEHFAGTGVLNVLKGYGGTIIILR